MPQKTIQKKLGPNYITDLHGDTYKLGDYQICLDFPKFNNYIRSAYTKDANTNKVFNLIICKDQSYAVFSSEMQYYVLYNITHISYNELEDIRKGYIYGNKYHA